MSSAAGCTLLSSAPFHPSLSPLMRNSPPVILSLSFVVKHNLTCHPHCQSPSSATYCTGPQKYGAKINLGIFHQLIVSCCSNDLYLYFSLAFHDKKKHSQKILLFPSFHYQIPCGTSHILIVLLTRVMVLTCVIVLRSDQDKLSVSRAPFGNNVSGIYFSGAAGGQIFNYFTYKSKTVL